MPCDHLTEAKEKFCLPEYPKEEKFDDPIKYMVAVKWFGVGHQWVFTEHDAWVEPECVTDLVHESKATHAKAAEEKKCWEMEKCPRKWGWADTAGSTIAEPLTSGTKQTLWVCEYCVK